MKTLTMRSMFAVAALVVAAASASAQTYKADIPVAFHAGDQAMAPGSYRFQVTDTSGHPVLTVSNLATGKSAILTPFRGSDAPKAWRQGGNPKVAFDCLAGQCTLRRLWNGQAVSTYDLPGRKLPAADMERMASITVTLTKGD